MGENSITSFQFMPVQRIKKRRESPMSLLRLVKVFYCILHNLCNSETKKLNQK